MVQKQVSSYTNNATFNVGNHTGCQTYDQIRVFDIVMAYQRTKILHKKLVNK